MNKLAVFSKAASHVLRYRMVKRATLPKWEKQTQKEWVEGLKDDYPEILTQLQSKDTPVLTSDEKNIIKNYILARQQYKKDYYKGLPSTIVPEDVNWYLGHNRAGLHFLRRMMDAQDDNDWGSFQFNQPEAPDYRKAYASANSLLEKYQY